MKRTFRYLTFVVTMNQIVVCLGCGIVIGMLAFFPAQTLAGEYLLTNVPVAQDVTLEFSADGYESDLRKNVTVTAGSTTRLDFDLPRSIGGFFGMVVDAKTCTSISGARLKIKGTSLVVYSDRGGSYDFQELPVGTIEVEVEAPGYRVETQTIEIEPMMVKTLNIVLESGGAMIDDRWTWPREKTKIVQGEPFTLYLPGGMEMAMQWIPPGAFDMGSPDEEIDELCREYDWIGESLIPYFKSEAPRHRVRITRGFWIGSFEVTQSQWQAVMENNPSLFKHGLDGVPPDTSSYPVETVSWEDCREFLEKLSSGIGHTCRLPTEAQWEYACRAGTTSRYAWGDEFIAAGASNIENATDNFGNAERNSPVFKKRGFPVGSTMPVGSFPPNPWNLFDMHGNVREWCRDWYSETCYRDSPGEAPTGPESGTERIIRGGSWYSEAALSRSAVRHSGTTDWRLNDIGFRIVISPEE